jgi:hypothetical protein
MRAATRRIREMAENLQFVDSEGGAVVFDKAIYQVGDTATAQWVVINAGDTASQDGEQCLADVTDPNGNSVATTPGRVDIPVLSPGQHTDVLTTQFQVTMSTGPTTLYTIIVTLPNGQSTQNTATVA